MDCPVIGNLPMIMDIEVDFIFVGFLKNLKNKKRLKKKRKRKNLLFYSMIGNSSYVYERDQDYIFGGPTIQRIFTFQEQEM